MELLIATSVLSLAVMGSLGAQLVCRNLARQSRETTMAMYDLEACLEELLLESPEGLPTSQEYADGQPIAAYQELHLGGETIVATYPGWDGGTVPNPLEVVLTISWDDFHGRERALELRTVASR